MSELQALMELITDLGAGILLFYQLVPLGRGRTIQEAALNKAANEQLIRFMADAQRESLAVIEPVAGPQ
ncbi:MAG TPA: radical SAM protein, partial [Spirochaetia bacterium]|nr:radical SAM protein [Spirochaetia bacterium]